MHVKARAALLMLLVACGGGGGGEETTSTRRESTVVVTPDNVVVVDSSRISAGPLLTGTLQPERMAQIRAELSGAMVSVATERGQRVGRGETLGRIDDATMQDNFISARSGVTTAEQAAAVARRNVERSEALLHAGAISESALEDARLQFQTAESQLADARARLVQAQTQLDKTTVRAPFAGIVSDRQINAGDIVQPGSALFTVVDPSSMRLEGAVPASELERVRVGANVEFTAAGYADRTFTGKVVRVNPTTDPATGQIPVIASIPNSGGDLVGGLYAEGLVATESRVGLIVPLSAVEIAQERAEVLRLRQGKSSVWPLRPVCAMNARSASKSQPASHAATRCSWARRGPYLQARA